MTCIVGYKNSDETFIGADSAASSKHQSIVRGDWKVFLKKDLIIGFSDSFAFGQLLEYKFEFPRWDRETGLYPYMVREFIPALKHFLEDERFFDIKKMRCSQFLIGSKGYLFKVGRDFQVAKYPYNYMAIGSGSAYALGVLHVLDSIQIGRHISVKEKLNKALEAAAEFSQDVRPPFNIVSA